MIQDKPYRLSELPSHTFSVAPMLDGTCGSLKDFFALLKQYLLSINLDEASEVVFCADGGKGIWPVTLRNQPTENLAERNISVLLEDETQTQIKIIRQVATL